MRWKPASPTVFSVTQDDAWQLADETELLQHCAPIFVLPGPGALPDSIEHNATVALVSTGQRTLLVTTCRIWDAYLTESARAPASILAVAFAKGSGQPIQLSEDRLVDFDRDLDLAVFDAAPGNWNLGSKRFHQPERWPIPTTKHGSPVGFVGFASPRRPAQGAGGEFIHSAYRLSATSASPRRMVLAAGQTRRLLHDNHGQMVPAMRMIGLSGSPAYARSRTGVFTLTGFIQMAQSSEDAIHLTHAAYLNPNGTLCH